MLSDWSAPTNWMQMSVATSEREPWHEATVEELAWAAAERARQLAEMAKAHSA
jgi:hypothetical protein